MASSALPSNHKKGVILCVVMGIGFREKNVLGLLICTSDTKVEVCPNSQVVQFRHSGGLIATYGSFTFE